MMAPAINGFTEAFKALQPIEGKYSNRKNDRGGKTKYGITEAVARANGYRRPMQELTLEAAGRIYKLQYWDTLRLDAIALLSYPIAYELFDTGVNMGIAVAARFLQRNLNAMNRGAELYADMLVDGVIGPVTVAALAEYLRIRGDEGEKVLQRALNSLQGARYIGIAEGDPTQEDNVYGWFRTRIVI